MTKKLSELFDVRYGNSLELNRLRRTGPEGIPFISRKMHDNGIAAYVELIDGIEPNPAGELTCAMSGNGVLSTFIQNRPYYTAFHVACLRPRVKLDTQELLYYCVCIRANRYRYSYGRQANRSLREILLPSPEDIPKWVTHAPIGHDERLIDSLLKLSSVSAAEGRTDTVGEQRVAVGELFDVIYGTNLELIRLERDQNGINFVSRTAKNNGVSARVKLISDVEPNPAKVLSVAGGGSVLETFLQLEPFYSGRDLFYLKPKVELNEEELLFYSAVIRANRFRFNYGRQANKTLPFLPIPTRESIPLWVYGGVQRQVDRLFSR
ncbi:restriction endonuclease subunit S [Alicyclobacillus sp. ALC3]|uniref:restriction endonuclease subunit S n=1 Tax=Alicyclobacillus sp. ALC3 TaxID=2796143 RepID=UPI002379C933|nr:restriction endonuclease subunit S [Alicyclobacillus sp. ALC3]